jgi:plasmid stability protein
MSAIVIRNLPGEVHDQLRRIAADRSQPVETVAREALTEFVNAARPKGVDFEKLERIRAELGFFEDGPSWPDEFDDPAFSRQVLGLEEPPPAKVRKRK